MNKSPCPACSAGRIAYRRCNKPPGSIRSNTPSLFWHQHP
nr:MAG TPA: hypothetical protein [Bacteriophage sp.]DAV71214.1 MAG TPA: hypothetical protein [Bacteriophage sp.]